MLSHTTKICLRTPPFAFKWFTVTAWFCTMKCSPHNTQYMQHIQYSSTVPRRLSFFSSKYVPSIIHQINQNQPNRRAKIYLSGLSIQRTVKERPIGHHDGAPLLHPTPGDGVLCTIASHSKPSRIICGSLRLNVMDIDNIVADDIVFVVVVGAVGALYAGWSVGLTTRKWQRSFEATIPCRTIRPNGIGTYLTYGPRQGRCCGHVASRFANAHFHCEC